MSWMLHHVSLDEGESIVNLNLVHAVQGLLIFLVVTSTNHEELTLRSIYNLEIVWEGHIGLSFVYFAGFLDHVNLVDILAVFLQNVEILERRHLGHKTLIGIHRLSNWLGCNNRLEVLLS